MGYRLDLNRGEERNSYGRARDSYRLEDTYGVNRESMGRNQSSRRYPEAVKSEYEKPQSIDIFMFKRIK